jgi:hypothetical protein
MRRTISFCVSVVSGILLALMAHAPAIAADFTLVVPTQYSTIQSAIDAAASFVANPGNAGNSYSVLVEPGTYAGGITLTSNVPVNGRETAATIITSSGTNAAVTASGVTSASFRNFTIINATVGISVSGNAVVSITNNVFQNSITAVQVQGSPSTEIINNTFYQNGTAVTRDSDSVRVMNNIFSNNKSNINQGSLTSQLNISYNCFNPGPLSGEPTGTNFIPNIAIENTDPLFVSPVNFDFHVQQQTAGGLPSPVIDTGDPTITDDIDGTRSDIGAYGGPNADSIPFPVTILTATAETDTIAISWSANNSYLVTNTDPAKQGGYNVYYSLNQSGAPYQTKLSLASTMTSTAIGGLTTSISQPAAPVLNEPGIANGTLNLTWSPVPTATSYLVYFLDTVTSVENVVNAGNMTSYSLTGLINDRAYTVSITAVAQPVYHLAVTAFDYIGPVYDPGIQHESTYSKEAVVSIGTPTESLRSNEITDFPEAIIPVPNLRNTGCFIATAAYGYYSAPQVRELREFRDRCLMTNAVGRAFVRWYYLYGPIGAEYINEHPQFKPLVRIALAPLIGVAFVMLHTSPMIKITVAMLSVLLFVHLLRKRYPRLRGNKH